MSTEDILNANPFNFSEQALEQIHETVNEFQWRGYRVDTSWAKYYKASSLYQNGDAIRIMIRRPHGVGMYGFVDFFARPDGIWPKWYIHCSAIHNRGEVQCINNYQSLCDTVNMFLGPLDFDSLSMDKSLPATFFLVPRARALAMVA